MDHTEREQKVILRWSEICSDALQLILESLSLPDFHRARTVCSTWYSVSKSCVAGSQNRYPWIIRFPEKNTETCRIFDPVAHKISKTRVAVADSGDALIVVSLKGFPQKKEARLFYLFKMNLEGDEWERLDSLGDDKVLLFGDGVIVAAASDGGGKIKRDSVYFVLEDVWPLPDRSMLESCGTFELATTKFSWSRCASLLSNNIRWVVPGSDRKL